MTATTEDKGIGSPKPAAELLDMYYLHMRSALLETAAGLDRLQRSAGGGAVSQDARARRLREMCAIIDTDEPDRTRRILKLLSVE